MGPNALAAAATRLSFFILFCGAVLTATVIQRQAFDGFRLPKELLLIGEGLLLAALATIEALLRGRPGTETPRDLRLVILSVLGWGTIATILASRLILALPALTYCLAALMVFVATYRAGGAHGNRLMVACVAAAALNAVLAILQRLDVWVLIPSTDPRSRVLGLLGNPNDVGVYLVPPFMACFTFALAGKRRRILWSSLACLLLSAVFASESVTALLAVTAGAVSVASLLSWRRAVAGAGITLVILLLGAALFPQRWASLPGKIRLAAAGNFDPLLSNRAPAFLSAWRMFVRHPAAGVGPGCFKYHYFDTKLEVEEGHPAFLNSNVMNFGQAHNEHLQVLAETGLPGYALFLAALWVLGRRSFVNSGTTGVNQRRARLLALPLSVAVGVLCLGQFPLRLAGPTVGVLMIAAVTMAWSDEHASD
jgi:O-antigen ligase